MFDAEFSMRSRVLCFPPGRQIIECDPYVLQSNPEKDLLLQDGDVLYIPKRPDSITVVGEVRTPSTHTFISGTNPTEYILSSGGFIFTARS